MSRQSQSLQGLKELSERFLMPETEIIKGLVEDILGTIFIDRVVSEMHVHVIDIVLAHSLVLFGGESHQSFVVDVDPEGIAARHQGIDPHVELEALVEEGVFEVYLDHALPVTFDLSHV